MTAVRPAIAADEAAWRALWQGYLAFYGARVPEAVTAATWARCLDPASGVLCRLAEVDGAVAGFAIVVVHPATWHLGPSAYLEDLFVAPAARRRGAAKALIETLAEDGRARGWNRLYWQTQPDNAAGHALYAQVGRRTDWVRYDREL